jgi:hypothetical protein
MEEAAWTFSRASIESIMDSLSGSLVSECISIISGGNGWETC